MAYWWQEPTDYPYLDTTKYEYFSNGDYAVTFANKSTITFTYAAVDNATATQRYWIEDDGTKTAYWSPPYWKWQFEQGFGLYWAASTWNYGKYNTYAWIKPYPLPTENWPDYPYTRISGPQVYEYDFAQGGYRIYKSVA